VAELLENGALESLPGVGKSIASKVEQLLVEGRLSLLESLREQVPEWLVALSEAHGIGPKTLSVLYKLRFSDRSRLLEELATEHLRKQAGITARQFEAIKQALTNPKRHWVQLAHADAIADELKEWLCRSVAWRAEKTGALRRRQDAVEEVQLLVGGNDPDSLERSLRDFRMTTSVRAEPESRWRLQTTLGIPVWIAAVQVRKGFERAWFATTGSDEHLKALGNHAASAGRLKELLDCLDLSLTKGWVQQLDREEQIYSLLGLSWIPPELREGRDEVELASRGALPSLVELDDVKGDLHLHTRWSDGIASIPEMAETASRLGYEYLAVTDHSASLRIANGLGAERILRQLQEIDALNNGSGRYRVLAGIEVDILPDGTLDLPDHILARLDWVVASVHSAMSMSEHEMMRRLERALSNPHVDALGHPTGRLLGKPGHIFFHREPFAIDWDRLLRICAEASVGLEINSFPERMDLPAEMAEQAAKSGIRLHLGTDAHAPEHLRLMRYGVDSARRAGLTKEALLNCRSLERFVNRERRSILSRKSGSRSTASKTKRVGCFGLRWDNQPRTFNRFFGGSEEIMHGRYRVVGIDLTASKSRPSGWALLQGDRASTRLLRTDAELIAATLDSGANLVSIDSPLSLPKGRCCAREECECRQHGIVRDCERSLMRMRIGVFPALLPSMAALTLRGIELARMFRERGIEVIESYPGAAQDMLGISRKRRGLDLLLDGLVGFGISLPHDSTLVHDELDAITSALVGLFWRVGEFVGLGIPEENELIVPRIPKFREGDDSIVVGLTGPTASGKTTIGHYLAFRYGFRYVRYSSLLREMMVGAGLQQPSRDDLQEFGWKVHQTMGPVELTRRLIARMNKSEHWVVDGLRHEGDLETLHAQYCRRFHLVFVEASSLVRARRLEGPGNPADKLSEREHHPVEQEIPLLSFRTTTRITNEGSFKALYSQIDRLIGGD
jgi:DNA polymerase (family 10)